MEKLALRWASGSSPTKTEGTIELTPERSYKIGSADGCDVRLPAGAPPIAAEIIVATRLDRKQQPGLHVTYLPYWDDGRGQMIADQDGRTTVDIGNTMELAGVKLELVDLSRPAYGRSRAWLVKHVKRYLARAEIARRHLRQYSYDIALLYGGSRRVGELMKKLGAVVHESEAEEVQSLFDTGHRTSVWVMGGFIFLCCLVLGLARPPTDSVNTMWPILIATAAVLFTLITSSFFCSAAGTVMIGSAAATTTLLLISPEDPTMVALFTTLYALIGALVGYVMEAAWCPVLLDRRSTNARVALTMILGIAALLLWALVASNISQWLLAGCALLLAWTWLGVSWRSRQFMKADRPIKRGGRVRRWWRKRCITRIPSADASLLLSVAWVRWRRQLLARALSVILVITPVLALLNSLNLHERMGLTTADDTPMLLWREHAVMLDDEVFEDSIFYFIPEAAWTERADQIERTNDDSGILRDAERMEDLRVRTLNRALELANSEAGADFWWLSDAETGQLRLASFSKNTAAGWWHQFNLYQLLKIPTVLLVVLAVLILWRASGEGAPAIAVGLWALGYASAMSFEYIESRFTDFVPVELRTLQQELFESSRGDLLAELLMVVNAAFSGVAVVWGLVTLGAVATMSVVVTWCWPAPLRGPDGRLRLGSVTARAFVVVLVSSACVLAVFALNALASRLGISLVMVDFAGMALIITAPLLVAWQLRRLQRRRHPELVNTTWLHAAVITLPGLITFAYFVLAIHYPEYQVTSMVILGVLTALLALALFHFVVLRNEWNLAGGRTLSSVIVIILVPIVLKALEHLLLERLQHAGLFPIEATTVAAVLLAVCIFPFVHRVIEHVLEFFVLRRLHAVTEKIPAIIERLVTNRDEDQRRAEIKALLDDVGLKRYFFYSRQTSEKGEFACQLSTFDDSCAPDIELSDRLLRQLAREQTFLDFNMTMREVDYTFTASELWRLQRRLGFENTRSDGTNTPAGLQPRCQYLLPIALGDAVCGLIVAGSQPLPSAIRFERFVAYLQQLGVAATTGTGRVAIPRASAI